MNRVFESISTFVKKVSKKHIVVAIVAASVIAVSGGNVMAGWGPERPILDWTNPADRAGFDHVAFNSFVRTDVYGDERTFFDGKDAANTNPGGFTDAVNAVGKDELTLRVYVHNNANQYYNDSGVGIARNTRVKIALPTGNSKQQRATAYISADNARPGTVTDTVDIQGDGSKPFELEYVPGSARILTNAMNTQLPDSVVTTGTQIGYDRLNGNIPGCFPYTSIVTIKVKVKQTNISVDKFVRKVGQTEWVRQNEAKPGDTLEYAINAKNIGKTKLNKLVIGDNLPPFVKYVNGSTTVKNGSFPNGRPDTTNNVTKGGIEIGNYLPNANAIVYFKVKLDDEDKFQCGVTTLKNIGVVRAEGTNEFYNEARTVVRKECKPPIYKCEGLTAENIRNNVYKLTVTEKLENARAVKYIFTIDGGKKVESRNKTINYDFVDNGKHKVSAVIVTDKGTTVDVCEVTIEGTTTPPPVTPNPETPTTLPRTGSAATAVIGIGAMGAAVRAFVNSKRGLIKSLLSR